jgi:CubicO group peptidase (beta-lactamase class C family)
MRQIQGLTGSALVTRAGSVRAEFAHGPADIETGTECTAQTRFQLCSVSKQFAAAAALLLVESGQLDLAEPVARWLPFTRPAASQTRPLLAVRSSLAVTGPASLG